MDHQEVLSITCKQSSPKHYPNTTKAIQKTNSHFIGNTRNRRLGQCLFVKTITYQNVGQSIRLDFKKNKTTTKKQCFEKNLKKYNNPMVILHCILIFKNMLISWADQIALWVKHRSPSVTTWVDCLGLTWRTENTTPESCLLDSTQVLWHVCPSPHKNTKSIKYH